MDGAQAGDEDPVQAAFGAGSGGREGGAAVCREVLAEQRQGERGDGEDLQLLGEGELSCRCLFMIGG